MSRTLGDAIRLLHDKFPPSTLFPDHDGVRGNSHGGPDTLATFFIPVYDDVLLTADQNSEDIKQKFSELVYRYIDCQSQFKLRHPQLPSYTSTQRKSKWKFFRQKYMHDNFRIAQPKLTQQPHSTYQTTFLTATHSPSSRQTVGAVSTIKRQKSYFIFIAYSSHIQSYNLLIFLHNKNQ